MIVFGAWLTISIHALRKESDVHRIRQSVHGRGISIHALRKESDKSTLVPAGTREFQSTLSVRRATNPQTLSNTMYLFQSTLSVRRATIAAMFSISPSVFQSTLSVRRATSHDQVS